MPSPLHLACLLYIRTHPDWTLEATQWPIGADWDDMIAAQRAIYREARTKDASIEKMLAEYDKYHGLSTMDWGLVIGVSMVIVGVVIRIILWLVK